MFLDEHIYIHGRILGGGKGAAAPHSFLVGKYPPLRLSKRNSKKGERRGKKAKVVRSLPQFSVGGGWQKNSEYDPVYIKMQK